MAGAAVDRQRRRTLRAGLALTRLGGFGLGLAVSVKRDSIRRSHDWPHCETRVVIEKIPMVPSQYINLPDHVTVAVQTTDGRHFTQDA
jgi:hypothetical protein